MVSEAEYSTFSPTYCSSYLKELRLEDCMRYDTMHSLTSYLGLVVW